MQKESHVAIPVEGQKITIENGKLYVPHHPVIPFIEGDGIGVDVTPAMIKVVDAAVKKAYQGERKIAWMEIYTGEKSTRIYGEDEWLPEETPEYPDCDGNIRQQQRNARCPVEMQPVIEEAANQQDRCKEHDQSPTPGKQASQPIPSTQGRQHIQHT